MSEVQRGGAKIGERGSALRDGGKCLQGIDKKGDAEMERNPLMEKCVKRKGLNGGLEELMKAQRESKGAPRSYSG